ncbi:MAG TPA: TonB family protein [Puia sp.]|nr:TonB family protein [Puia sp.]
MEAKKILQSDILDILFDRRNKEYGAYQLRKYYNKRLFLSLAAVAALTGLSFGISYLAGRTAKGPKQVISVVDVQLEEVTVEKKLPPPPPPPPRPPLQKVEITKFTPPRIVKDQEVKVEERPPEQEKLAETKIGAINQEGVKDLGIAGPPTGDLAGKGVVEAPPATKGGEDYDRTFTKVEIESEYPGGIAAWLRYLNKNFRYPEDALNNEVQGTVVVEFIVDKEGSVSDVQAVSGPTTGGLREEAMRVIRQSGKWTPAIQNGRKVKSYKKQPIIFELRNT